MPVTETMSRMVASFLSTVMSPQGASVFPGSGLRLAVASQGLGSWRRPSSAEPCRKQNALAPGSDAIPHTFTLPAFSGRQKLINSLHPEASKDRPEGPQKLQGGAGCGTSTHFEQIFSGTATFMPEPCPRYVHRHVWKKSRPCDLILNVL